MRGWIYTLAATLALCSVLRADDIEYRDRSKGDKPTKVTGKIIEEAITGLKFKPATGKDLLIAPDQIVEVTFDMPPDVRLNDLGVARSAEGKAEFGSAIAGYSAMLPKLSKHEQAARHIKFKIASLRALWGDTKPDEKLPAIDELKAFLADNPKAWQSIMAGRNLARLYLSSDKFEEAAKVLEDTAKLDGLPKDIKHDLVLQVIDALIASGKAGAAGSKIEATLRTLPKDDPQVARLNIYLLGTKSDPNKIDATAAQLKATIEQATDPKLKALALNTLGDCYSAAKKYDEARWAHLFVELVFNQDRNELARAVDRLAKVFKELKDEARADEYKAKLKSLR